MIDFFVSFFSNAFNIVMGLLFVVIGILIGVVIVRYVLKPKNQILYCRERDGRGMELNVDKEDAISLETATKPPLRFFKWGRAYEFIKRGRAFTRFFGKEGTAYSWRLFGFSGKKGNPVKTTLEFPTLEDAVKHKWGKTFYWEVPEKRKAQLRDDKVLVTVNLEPGIVPEGYEPITESVIKKKAYEDMAELFARSARGAIKKTVLDWMPWLLAGAGIMAIGSKLLGWW